VDDAQVLLGRIDSLLQELDDSRHVLDTLNVDEGLLDRASGSFEKLFKEQRAKLDDLRKTTSNGGTDSGSWIDLDTIERDTRPLFREYLAFIEGLLARRNGVDNGVCSLADALLDDVDQRTGISWRKFTILAEGEAYADLAGIIRLRFPDLTVWNVPVAAHEFGHFAAERIEAATGAGPKRRPFVELLEGQTLPIQRPAEAAYGDYAHEFFADTFATYVVGPAYAFDCLLLRFNPRTVNVDGRMHPSPARRAQVVLRTLERIDEEEAKANRLNHPYSTLVGVLREAWTASVRAAGQTEELPPAVAAELDEITERYWRIISRGVNPDGMYATKAWRRAEAIAEGLLSNTAPDSILSGNETMADILNGAWLARFTSDLRPRSAVSALSRSVFDLGQLHTGAP